MPGAGTAGLRANRPCNCNPPAPWHSYASPAMNCHAFSSQLPSASTGALLTLVRPQPIRSKCFASRGGAPRAPYLSLHTSHTRSLR